MTNTTNTTIIIAIVSVTILGASLIYYQNTRIHENSMNSMMGSNYNNSANHMMPNGNMMGGMMNNTNNMMMQTPQVKDDKTFIQYVIPHHQDAIDSSSKILASTQDPELKAFVANVIKTQGQEITMLKSYYKTWYGEEYKDDGGYKPMMMLENLTGKQLDKAYIQGMLGHHSGIIDVAKKVVADTSSTYKPETVSLSRQIIKDQEVDNVVLQKWLDSKYTSSNTSTMSSDVYMGN